MHREAPKFALLNVSQYLSRAQILTCSSLNAPNTHKVRIGVGRSLHTNTSLQRKVPSERFGDLVKGHPEHLITHILVD